MPCVAWINVPYGVNPIKQHLDDQPTSERALSSCIIYVYAVWVKYISCYFYMMFTLRLNVWFYIRTSADMNIIENAKSITELCWEVYYRVLPFEFDIITWKFHHYTIITRRNIYWTCPESSFGGFGQYCWYHGTWCHHGKVTYFAFPALSEEGTHSRQNGFSNAYRDRKVHGAIMGSIWGRQEPGGPYVCPINFSIWVTLMSSLLLGRMSCPSNAFDCANIFPAFFSWLRDIEVNHSYIARLTQYNTHLHRSAIFMNNIWHHTKSLE